MKTYEQNGLKAGYEIGCCLMGMRTIPDDSIDLIITDPPYNKGKTYEGDIDDSKPQKIFDQFNRDWITQCLRILKPGHHFYFSCASDQSFYFKDLIEELGFKFRHLLIWSTNECKGHMNARTWLRSYEPFLWCQKQGDKSYGLFNNFPYPALDVLRYFSPKRNMKGDDHKDHICQKPVELFSNIIKKSSRPGDLVFDPFLGSGTTLMASLKEGRSSIGFEISVEYESIIQNRMFEYLNQTSLKTFEGLNVRT